MENILKKHTGRTCMDITTEAEPQPNNKKSKTTKFSSINHNN